MTRSTLLLAVLVFASNSLASDPIEGLDTGDESPRPSIENPDPVQTPRKSYRDTKDVYAKVQKQIDKFNKCIAKEERKKKSNDKKIESCKESLEEAVAEAPPGSREKLKEFIKSRMKAHLERST